MSYIFVDHGQVRATTGKEVRMVTHGSDSVSKFPNRDLTIMREIDAPRGLVFECWINSKHVAEWWGPEGFSNPRCEMDVRPGGAIRIDMQGPDGTIYPTGGFYEEIERPERLVFSNSALDGLGHPLFDVLTGDPHVSSRRPARITVQFKVSTFGFPMQDSSDFKFSDRGLSKHSLLNPCCT